MKPKADPLEEAQFRMDEHERRLDGIEKSTSPDTVVPFVTGAVAALEGRMQAKHMELLDLMQKILTATAADGEADRALTQAVRELIDTLKAPVTRTASISLPSGPAVMKVQETR